MAQARSGNGFGPNPISYVEIAAWAKLTGIQPTPWEVSVLRLMDDATLEAAAKKKSGRREFKPDDWEEFDKAFDRFG